MTPPNPASSQKPQSGPDDEAAALLAALADLGIILPETAQSSVYFHWRILASMAASVETGAPAATGRA